MSLIRKYFEPNVLTKTAVFAQGCFWGSDGLYAVVPGVVRMKVGYTGGKKEKPTYRDLGDHTEACLIEYDPSAVTLANLLSIFWSSHDPTVLNKAQYKSAVYYNDEKERLLTEETLNEEQKRYKQKIVTEILPESAFYNAEDYHQKYILRSHHSLFNSLKLDGESLIKSHVGMRLNGYLSGHGTLEQFEKESPVWGLTDEELGIVREVVKKGLKIMCH